MFRAAGVALALFLAPCVAPQADGTCPDGYRHLYPKTENGPCVDARAK